MSKYDRFMVHVDLGTEEKLADFTDAERLCHIVGVLAIAAKSPIRGQLIVGEAEATASHIAKRADVSRKVAESTLRKLKAVGILVRDDDAGAWAVHAWEAFNPPPKVDRTNADRQARYRARHGRGNAASNGVVTGSNGREVEEEGEVTPLGPPASGGALPPLPVRPGGRRARGLAAFQEQLTTYAAAAFPDVEPTIAAGLLGTAVSDLGDKATHESVAAYVRRWTQPDPTGATA